MEYRLLIELLAIKLWEHGGHAETGSADLAPVAIAKRRQRIGWTALSEQDKEQWRDEARSIARGPLRMASKEGKKV